MFTFASLQAPQVAITASAPGSASPVRSRIGGVPDAPVDFDWPRWNDTPLSFLAQIALEELPRDVVGEDLPENGTLAFFYDGEQRTWGFDPKDRGSWRVFYFPSEPTLRPATVPHGVKQYSPRELSFGSTVSYADQTSPTFASVNLTAEEKEAYLDFLVDHVGGRETMTTHRLLGHAYVIQGHMELGCQLASNGVDCGTPEGFESERGRALAPGAKDWRLLFQLDSDDGAGMMWGDGGRLYFWIRKSDLEERAFDKVWMKLECY